jgi:hypothetical protein
LVSRLTTRSPVWMTDWALALGAPHDGVDARDQLVPVERLGHVVIGAEAEPPDLVLDAGKARQDVAPQLLRGRSVQRNKRVRVRIWRRAWDIDYLQVGR